jgi:Ca2+-binding EF-hand superfamily protein
MRMGKELTMSTLGLVLSVALLIGCCKTPINHHRSDWAYFEGWDNDRNVRLDLQEFMIGYTRAEFFNRWQVKSGVTSDSSFMLKTFTHLDRNDNGTLDPTEFNSRRVLWSFQGALKLGQWDRNQDNLIGLDEFMQNSKSEKLVLNFDLNVDGSITEAEMAEGMFAVCDKNSDNSVGPKEFYVWEVYRR